MHTATNPFPNSTAATPRDLRSGGPAEAGGGKTYPVDPAAVARLKAHLDEQKATSAARPQTAVPSVKRTAPAPLAKIDPASYSPEVIAAARAQERIDGRRDIASVLTDEVLAIWAASGLSTKMIAKKAYNGLIQITQSQASKYLRSYRERMEARPETAVAQSAQLAQAAAAPPAAIATAVAQPGSALVEEDAAHESGIVDSVHNSTETQKPDETAVEPFVLEKPENLPAFLDRDYVAQPPAGPGDALATLAALVNDQSLRVRGSVKLNLEIEFGE